MNFAFGEVLSRAWRITWRHKILWVFGFFVSLMSGGNGGSSNSRLQMDSSDLSRSSDVLPPELQQLIHQLEVLDWNSVYPILIGVCACLLLLWVGFFLLSIIGSGGLIGGILKADAEGALSFGEAWELGKKYFIRILCLNLILIAGVLIFLAAMIVPVILAGVLMPLVFLCICPLICAFALVMIAVSLYFMYVEIAIVAEDISLGEGLRKGWVILKGNIGAILILSLILFAIGLGVGVATLLINLPAAALFFGSILPILMETGALNLNLLIAGIVMAVLLTPVVWLIQAVWTTYSTAVYTLAYKEFRKKEESALDGLASMP